MRIIPKSVVLFAVVLLAQAAPAGGEQVIVKQSRPLIYTTPQVAGLVRDSAAESGIEFEVVKTHTAGWKNFLVSIGFAHPFFQVKLSILPNGGGGEAAVKEARWEFPTEYFFPEDTGDITGADVLVNVWRSFPVTAHVSFADGSEKTITQWIEPEAYLAQQ